MAYLRSESVTVTTAADGSATAYTAGLFNGLLHAIVYTKPQATPLADAVVITITGEVSGITLWGQTYNPANTVTLMPRGATASSAGAASLYAAAGAAVNDKLPLVNERIKIVLASGGDTKHGTFQFIVGD